MFGFWFSFLSYIALFGRGEYFRFLVKENSQYFSKKQRGAVLYLLRIPA